MKLSISLLFCLIVCLTVKSQIPSTTVAGDYYVMTYHNNSGIQYGILITTQIPFDQVHSPVVRIDGYDIEAGTTIGLNVSWFGDGGKLHGRVSSHGGIAPVEVNLLKDQNNRAAIYIRGFKGRIRFTITAFAQGFGEDPAWFDKWEIADQDPGSVPYQQLLTYYNEFRDAVNVNGRLDVRQRAYVWDETHLMKDLFVYDANNRPTIFIKNDIGETANPAAGGLVAGSAFGGGILFGNNWQQSGVANRYLHLGRVDNAYNFSPVITVGSENLNVGIGTTTPNASLKLDVVGNTGINGKLYIGQVSSAVMSTLQSEYLLAVNGTALFNKVKVKLYPWPDYVFEPEYNLLPLTKLEEYIKKYKHLPNVATAKEVESDGVDVGETQAALLRKIEELTLYIIEQNKRIEVLEKKILGKAN